jgi:hypothetical protein
MARSSSQKRQPEEREGGAAPIHAWGGRPCNENIHLPHAGTRSTAHHDSHARDTTHPHPLTRPPTHQASPPT